MDIGPGYSVDLILQLDLLKDKIDVRRAIIYDVEGDEYILSQTTPPVRPSDMGKIASVTRLIPKGGQRLRWGFTGTLIDIIRNYRLGSSLEVLALCVRKTSPLETHNLRMHYRVRPSASWSARIEVDLMPVNLIDISLGGVLFSHGSGKIFEPGRLVQVTYTGPDRKQQVIRSVVKRAWAAEEARRPGLEFVAVQFIQLDKELERELGREIMELQRASLYKV
jgi:hypothetical protein